MIQYQQIVVSTQAAVGQPGPLPAHLHGLSDASLANLAAALNAQAVTQLGLQDTGFLPVVVADPPPASINRLQFVTALQNAGKYNAVNTAISALAVTDPTRIYFTQTLNFGRSDPRLVAFAAAMGQTPAQVDALFVAASLIPA